MPVRLRALEEPDLPAAARLLADEGWGFTPKELARLLATGPGLSVAAEDAGALAGVVTVARHGDLAWVGNVVVHELRRGRGLGEAMVREALARAGAAGVRTTKLCSVPKAVALYRRVGFADEGPIATYAGVHTRPTHRPREAELLFPDDLADLAALDRRAFGADRSALLAQLLRDYPDTGVGVRGPDGALRGYAFLKHGDEGSELGPLVMARPDPALAAQLLDGALGFRLQGSAAGLECSAHAAHPFIGALLEARGLAPRDTKTLMWHGAPRAQDWAALGALGGLEKG